MSNILLVGALIVIFFVSVFSPQKATEIQREADKKSRQLEGSSNWLWSPLAWWAKKSIEFSKKIVKKDAEAGKKTRKKL